MHPAFLRFPGGSFSEAAQLKDAYRWKETIGDVATRPGHWNIWGYRSSDGLGYHEYLQLCEDLGAVPLYVANCGMAEQNFAPLDELESWIQDAMDAIEYANSPVTTPFGALRAKNGHPKPFRLKYLEIGNENGVGYPWGGGKREDYLPRYKPFFERINAKYPEIITIANIDTEPDAPAEIVDEHYYNPAPWFREQATRYDNYDRKKRPLYLGEFAVTTDAGNGNMSAALGEAAFMTGLERNGDAVVMSSYAPLFVRPAWKRWNPNAIVFDGTRSYGTPSYYVQAMFAANRADLVLPVTIEKETSPIENASQPTPNLFAVAGRQEKSGEIILKVVNTASTPTKTTLRFRGVKSLQKRAKGLVLSAANAMDENSFEAPTKIAPRATTILSGTSQFETVLAANSVTVLRFISGGQL